MIQVPPVQQKPSFPITIQPSYNAVKIDIHNPLVNAPMNTKGQNQQAEQEPNKSSVYDSVPKASIYDVPKKSLYEVDKSDKLPPAVKEVSLVPAPVVLAPVATTVPQATSVSGPITATAPISSVAPVAAVAAAATVSPAVVTQTQTQTTSEPQKAAEPQKVEIQDPEKLTSKIDINEFINKLISPDFEQQANAMESIADTAQNKPKEATEFLDVKVIDSLLGIMQKDSSKLAGPNSKQLQIREKIMAGKSVTAAETAEANKITPMELAERNKQYAIYTVAILQKLYGSEVEKLSNSVVPLTELPGAAGIVEQVKKNPNPMVRAAGIDALSYIQRPDYKQDLTTIFTVAKKDKDANVQKVATKALDKLAQVANTPVTPEVPTTPQTQPKKA